MRDFDKNDFFKTNSLVLITRDGNLITTERSPDETRHGEAFKSLEKKLPIIFENYPEKIADSGGYELASFLAADNNVIIFPSDINSPDILIILIPETLTNEQCKTLYDIEDSLIGYETYLSKIRFKNKRSFKTIHTSIVNSGDCYEVINKLNEIMKISIILNKINQLLTLKNNKKSVEEQTKNIRL